MTTDNSPALDSMDALLRAVARTPEMTLHFKAGQRVDLYRIQRPIRRGAKAEVDPATARISSRIIIAIHHAGIALGRPYVVLEYLAGNRSESPRRVLASVENLP